MTKSKLGQERVCFIYCSTSQLSSKEVRTGAKGRNLEAGTDTEAILRGAADRIAPHGLPSLLYYRSEDYQPRDDVTHNRLGPPISTTRKCPTGLPTA